MQAPSSVDAAWLSQATTMEVRLEWFTHDIVPGGGQIMCIRQARQDSRAVVLSREGSQLLHALLQALAQDVAIPFGPAKQAVLKTFLAVRQTA